MALFLIGCFEVNGFERGIEWRAADSLARANVWRASIEGVGSHSSLLSVACSDRRQVTRVADKELLLLPQRSVRKYGSLQCERKLRSAGELVKPFFLPRHPHDSAL